MTLFKKLFENLFSDTFVEDNEDKIKKHIQ